MRKMWHLGVCSTCKRILDDLPADLDLQEIRSEPLAPDQLDDMVRLAGSHEALFSRRAMKYRQLGLHERQLGEADYRTLLLEHDTFLKRPVAIVDEHIFVGSAKKTVANLRKALEA